MNQALKGATEYEDSIEVDYLYNLYKEHLKLAKLYYDMCF